MKPVLNAYRKARFVAAHRRSEIVVPSSPHLDEEPLRYFEAQIATVSRYLEYGSGGSTVLAHKHVDCLVSVESDQRFCKAVKEVLDAKPSKAETHMIPVNIGLTEAWGKPLFKNPTARRVRRWRAYPQAPWAFFNNRKTEPELILVDGRFRVACVLESLLRQSETSVSLVLLDDYSDRPYYAAVNEFAELVDIKGRMGIFRKKPAMDRERCQLVLDGFYADFR